MSSEAAARRHPELAAAITAAARQPKPVYLFTGEPFETRAAAQALIDVLVPASRRAFNLEICEGRTTPTAVVLDSLRTPGFFPGTKVIWVRESPAFISGEKRGEVAKGLLGAWADGREIDAVEKLLTLVAMAGWSDDQFRETRWSNATKARVREVFGEDFEAPELAAVDAVHAACVARGLTVGAYRDDSGLLLEVLDSGLPPASVLIFTATTADARKRLFKRLREVGLVLDLNVARERSGALTREAVDALVEQAVRDVGKRLDPAARDLIVRRAGSDAAAVASELEKLCLFVGDQATISEADVRAVFRDMAESWIFDFTAALSTRQPVRALQLLRGLLEQGEPPLRVLAMMARELRLLLVARECLDASLEDVWRTDLQFGAFQARVLPRLDAETKQAFGNTHPFVLYKRFQDSARLGAANLREALVDLADLDARLKSSRTDAGLLLEAFLLTWCRPAPGVRVS